ncbi:hypothetical protein AAHE18_15G289000 [Arachis hypogaea]
MGRIIGGRDRPGKDSRRLWRRRDRGDVGGSGSAEMEDGGRRGNGEDSWRMWVGVGVGMGITEEEGGVEDKGGKGPGEESWRRGRWDEAMVVVVAVAEEVAACNSEN